MVLSTGDLAPWRSGTTSPLPVSLVDYSLQILKKMLLKMAMISWVGIASQSFVWLTPLPLGGAIAVLRRGRTELRLSVNVNVEIKVQFRLM